MQPPQPPEPPEPPEPPALRRSGRVSALLGAGAASWESAAVEQLTAPGSGISLHRRCLDLPDLLGAAATESAQVAVLSSRLPGLDGDSVARLHQHRVRVLVVLEAASPRTPAALDVERMGVDLAVPVADIAALAAQVRGLASRQDLDALPDWMQDGPTGAATSATTSGTTGTSGDLEGESGAGHPAPAAGSLLAVWGATGAPGRTTVAIGVAAELAHRGVRTTLLDADPYGGAVAQQLAILDEVSGLLAASRLANAGQLDVRRLAGLARALGPGLRVLTGLPRPGRWPEVRPAAFAEVLTTARSLDEVTVVDTGLGIEEPSDDPFGPFGSAPSRDDMTRAVLGSADVVVVVVGADPVGLSRGTRALLDLAELGDVTPLSGRRPAGSYRPTVVAINRMRASLGWDQREVAALVAKVAPQARLVFLPDDPAATDQALVAGRTLVETGEGPLRRALGDLTDTLLAELGLRAPEPARRRGARLPRRYRLPTGR